MGSKPVFAVDVGGVLASKQHDGEPTKGSVTALELLASRYDIHIVSQCGRGRALATPRWLEDNGFQIPQEKQHYIGFDEENKNRVLAAIKAEYLVDDRWKHIRPAFTLPNLFCVFYMNTRPCPEVSPYVYLVSTSTWEGVLTHLESIEARLSV